MLNKQILYALLFIPLAELGCSSIYNYKMDEKEKNIASSQSVYDEAHMFGMGDAATENKNVDEKISRFLNKEKNFEQGSSISDAGIISSIKELDKDSNIFNKIDSYYKYFLQKYGAVYGSGISICGPTNNIIDSSEKVRCVVLDQRGFENRCIINKMNKTQVKSCWLIAEDDDNQYYIDLSSIGEGYIYSMNLDGRSKYFSKNFLEFLDKLFYSYEEKIKSENYKEKTYQNQEQIHEKINILLQTEKFTQGSPIYCNAINNVIKKLEKNAGKNSRDEKIKLDICDIDKSYIEFLNEYGSIYSEEFTILGPNERMTDTDEKIKYMEYIQSEFEENCKKSRFYKEGEEKSRWLIAKDETYKYYISLEENPLCKGAIYRINSDANVIRFAENFSDFLDKFIKVCK